MTTETPPPNGSATGQLGGVRDAEAPAPGSIADLYREVLPAVAFEADQTKWDVALTVGTADLRHVVQVSQQDPRLAMNLCRNQTAVDWEDKGMEVVYHLYSTEHRHAVAIKTWVPAEGASLPSMVDLHPGLEWPERECREMFGIEFEGHPDPRNLLLDEDLDIHPLLKSHPLAPIEIKQGDDVAFFRKENPREKPKAAGEKKAAPKKKAEKKPAEDLTPEELAEKKAEQAERIKKARELAAARRNELGGTLPKIKAKGDGAAKAEAAPATAEPETEATPATPAAPAADDAPPPKPKAAAPAPPAGGDGPKPSASERVARARELAAKRREELRQQQEGS